MWIEFVLNLASLG